MGSIQALVALVLLCFVAEYCYGQEFNEPKNSRLRSFTNAGDSSKPNLRAALQRLVHNKPLPHPDVLAKIGEASAESAELFPRASDSTSYSLRSALFQDAEGFVEAIQPDTPTLQDIIKEPSVGDVSVEEIDGGSLDVIITNDDKPEFVQPLEIELDTAGNPPLVIVEEIVIPQEDLTQIGAEDESRSGPLEEADIEIEASRASYMIPRRRLLAPRPCDYDCVPMYIKGSNWAFPGQDHSVLGEQEVNPFEYELPYRHVPEQLKVDVELESELGSQNPYNYLNQPHRLQQVDNLGNEKVICVAATSPQSNLQRLETDALQRIESEVPGRLIPYYGFGSNGGYPWPMIAPSSRPIQNYRGIHQYPQRPFVPYYNSYENQSPYSQFGNTYQLPSSRPSIYSPYRHSAYNQLMPFGQPQGSVYGQHPQSSVFGQNQQYSPLASGYSQYNPYGPQFSPYSQHYPYGQYPAYSQYRPYRQSSAYNQYYPYGQQSAFGQYQYQPESRYTSLVPHAQYSPYGHLNQYGPYSPFGGVWNKNGSPYASYEYNPYSYNNAGPSYLMQSKYNPLMDRY